MLEKAIQSKVRASLEAQGFMVVKLMSTSLNGIPDLMVLRDGRASFIEVKQPGKKPTLIQKWVMAKLQSLGFPVFVVTCKEQIKDYAKNHRGEGGGLETGREQPKRHLPSTES